MIGWYFWVTSLILIVGGALAASSLILAKKPNARDLLMKVAPYQGSIGVVMFLWGIYDLIVNFLLHLGEFGIIFAMPIFWKLFGVFMIVGYLCELLVGFLLGFGMITAFAAKKSPAAAQKAEVVMKKLAPWQSTLGIIAIIAGIYWLLFSLFLWKIGLGI
ncbi:MAG: hypothetical protein JXB32_22055 [Deltaproteobacteria bacterium]|nr:hypothetical protein [Deltaproteobacteria bacterium]